MAREIRGVAPTGNTLYARILNSAGLWWNGTTFEAYAAANWANYRVPLSEQGASGVFVGDFPSAITTGGTYEYYVHLQALGVAAQGDNVVNTGKVDWSGTAVIAAVAGAMLGSDFLAYVLRRGFKRTDKNAEIYEAVTDAIQEMRRRFMFDEAETEAITSSGISTLGTFKIPIESDLGLLLGVVHEDQSVATPMDRVTKARYDELYPYVNVSATFTGYPRHYCVYAGQIYIGPIPDKTTYNYRLSYSRRAGTITSTSSVPFTNLYRDVLADLVMALLYDGLEETDKAQFYRQKFEGGFLLATRRERQNTGASTFIMRPAL